MAGRQWRERGGGILCATLALLLVTSGEVTAEPPPRWEETNPAAFHQNVAIAVCLPREEEIVCVGVVCRRKGGYDVVEMITGDWLEGPTRLAGRANAIECGRACHDDLHAHRPARVPRHERARVPRPRPPDVPLAAYRA